MKKILLCAICFACVGSVASAQSRSNTYQTADVTTLGMGLGLTYGGLGMKFTRNFNEYVGLMAGVGYNFDNLGYNIGTQLYLPSQSKAQAYVSAMYGTNGVIIVDDLYGDSFKESYTGVSFGFGINLRSKRTKGNFVELGLIVPIHGSDYKDDWDDIKNTSGIETTDPWPVLINVGYNFNIN